MGEVFLVFGDGTLLGELDTAVPNARILRLQGADARWPGPDPLSEHRHVYRHRQGHEEGQV